MATFSRRQILGTAALSAFSMALAACGGDDDSSSGASSGPAVSDADVEAALQAGGTILVWAWEPTLKQVVEKFKQDYPKVTVNLVNAGTGADQYTALENAFSAGNGIPDLAQIEYFALPQFVLKENIADLTRFGAPSLQPKYTTGPWTAVTSGSGEGVYGLPMDSGPMAMFYNQEVFDKHKLTVPTTWEEYVETAKKLTAADPKAFIANDLGDAGFTTSMIWQAGGRPYAVNGEEVSINFADAGSQKFAALWQQLISGKLLAPIQGWTDQWYQGLGNGTIATLITGAWMPANFVSGVKDASGKWRAAPMPQWAAGEKASSESGGSSLAMPEKAANKELAYGFLKYATDGAGVKARIDNGAFPATVADLQSQEFLDTEFEYFGGQKANQIFADSAAAVGTGWSYLPFQVYANKIFNDTAGQAYISSTTLADGLKAWQEQSVKYGQEQGFTVK